MKRLHIYIICILAALSSCKEEISYDLSEGRPILFSQGALEVESRTGSLNSLNNKTFGVRAFKYTSTWTSEKPLAKPDPVWQNVQVKCDASGLCNYVLGNMKLQTWERKMNYTFFGYYPYNNPSLTLSDVNDIDTPKFTYILSDLAVGNARNNWKGSASGMYDVMYGSVVDANELKNTTVEIPFKHCLYGAQVMIENFGDEPVTIEQLSVTLTLKYRGIKMAMDGSSIKRIPFDGSSEKLVTFDYITTNDTPVQINSTLNVSPVDVSENKHLLLIPQENMFLTAKVKTSNSTRIKEINQNFPNTELHAGIRYIFDIQFIGDAINLIIIEGSEWDLKDSNIEFE